MTQIDLVVEALFWMVFVGIVAYTLFAPAEKNFTRWLVGEGWARERFSAIVEESA